MMGYSSEDDSKLSAFLDFAKSILGKRKKTLEELSGKRIRVVRAIVFEGEATAVFCQLQKSLRSGEHRYKVHNPLVNKSSELVITVAEGDFKIIE
jgi:hypothetical protein